MTNWASVSVFFSFLYFHFRICCPLPPEALPAAIETVPAVFEALSIASETLSVSAASEALSIARLSCI